MNSPIPPHHQKRIFTKLRAYFFAGILVTAPISITIWFSMAIIDFIDQKIIPLIPAKFNPDTYIRDVLGFALGLPGLGVVVLLLVITLIGAMATGFAGRWAVSKGEQLMDRMPLIRSLYRMVKQLFETVLTDQSKAFRQAVLVEYPRRDAWTIGFVTADPADQTISRNLGLKADQADDLIAVFVPTTPNPTSGFLLFVPRGDIRALDIPVDEAFKQLISIGIVASDKAGKGKQQ